MAERLHGSLQDSGAREQRFHQNTGVGQAPVNTDASGRTLPVISAPERTSLLGSLLSPEERRMEGVHSQLQAQSGTLDEQRYHRLLPIWTTTRIVSNNKES